jgi:hypothetical protein
MIEDVSATEFELSAPLRDALERISDILFRATKKRLTTMERHQGGTKHQIDRA